MIRGFYVNAYALPGGGGQTFGCSEFGHRTTFHNAERFVSHEPPKRLSAPVVREEANGSATTCQRRGKREMPLPPGGLDDSYLGRADSRPQHTRLKEAAMTTIAHALSSAGAR